MALDETVVSARLAALEEYLRYLQEAASVDLAAFTADPRTWASAERFLQLAIESILDIGTHCIAGLGLSRPERYADVLPALAAAGIIRPETAQALSSVAGFRNLLVHDYMKVDRARVHEFLNSRLQAFRDFAADVSRYLQSRERREPFA